MNNENRGIYISLENLTEFKELNDSLTDSKLGAKYTKPQTGIPKTDLAQSVQDSLDLADSAIQTHQDLSNYVTFDDTPSTNKAGVVKANEKYNFATGNSSEKGIPLCAVNDYATY